MPLARKLDARPGGEAPPFGATAPIAGGRWPRRRRLLFALAAAAACWAVLLLAAYALAG